MSENLEPSTDDDKHPVLGRSRNPLLLSLFIMTREDMAHAFISFTIVVLALAAFTFMLCFCASKFAHRRRFKGARKGSTSARRASRSSKRDSSAAWIPTGRQPSNLAEAAEYVDNNALEYIDDGRQNSDLFSSTVQVHSLSKVQQPTGSTSILSPPTLPVVV